MAADDGSLVPVQLESLSDRDHEVLAKLKADNDNLRATNDNEAAQIKVLTQRVDAAHH
jgi:cell division protein FtsB